MGSRWHNRDLISDLPVGLIERILVFLPIRDAIRTSILSTKWRFRWTTIPHLHFDEDNLVFDGDEDGDIFKTFVTRTLSRHEGHLHKFSLVSDLKSCSETDQWLIFLRRKDIKELILDITNCDFDLPSCLFSFQKLTYLELSGCLFSSLPPNFKGFFYLKTLILQYSEVHMSTIQSIVDQSPLLENLEFTGGPQSSGSELKIRAPKLKYLSLIFKNMDLEDQNWYLFAPLLAKMSLSVEINRSRVCFYVSKCLKRPMYCYYTKLLGGFANLETLTGDGPFAMYLSVGIEHYQHPLVFRCLKTINLGEVNFSSMDEIWVAVRLIVDASATLCDLQLSISHPGNAKIYGVHFLDSIYPQNCTFGKLKFVKIEDFCGGIQEMIFIKFLLESSPVLEKMDVRPADNQATNNCTLNSIVEMLSYRRASINASILFNHRYE